MKSYKFDIISPLMAAIINSLGPFVSKQQKTLINSKAWSHAARNNRRFCEQNRPQKQLQFFSYRYNCVLHCRHTHNGELDPFRNAQHQTKRGSSQHLCCILLCGCLYCKKFQKFSNPPKSALECVFTLKFPELKKLGGYLLFFIGICFLTKEKSNNVENYGELDEPLSEPKPRNTKMNQKVDDSLEIEKTDRKNEASRKYFKI